mgnify:FL=1
MCMVPLKFYTTLDYVSYFNTHTDSVCQFSQINTWITGSEKAKWSRELRLVNLTSRVSFHLFSRLE